MYTMKHLIPLLKRLEVQVILALIFAVLFGIHFPEYIDKVSWMGPIFISLLKVFLAPLLLFSIIGAIIGLGDIKKLGNLWIKTIGYYMLTTTLAISVSLVLMNLFQPGVGAEIILGTVQKDIGEGLSMWTFLESMISWNALQSILDVNAMQIVLIGMVLWIAILTLKKKETKLLGDIFSALNTAILKFIMFVIKLTPLWVFAIVAKVTATNGTEGLQALLPFSYIILAALAIHAIITLPILAYFLGKTNPYKYFTEVKEAILVGFSTASSSATMWLSMKTAEEKGGVSKEVVHFTIPLGTTVNMDGTALYQAWVAIFVAQVLGIDLTILQQITVVFIVILASVGAAGIPGAGILILATVFLSIGLPVEAIWIILAVDRILDMFRTAVNVWGDLITAKIIDKFYKKNLQK